MSVLSPLVGYVAQLPAESSVFDKDPAVLGLRELIQWTLNRPPYGDNPEMTREYGNQMMGLHPGEWVIFNGF